MKEVVKNNELVFANNIKKLEPYVPDKLFKEGIVLSPPAKEEEFATLFKVCPNGTLLLISNDPMTTYREYGNKYIKKYISCELMALSNNSISCNMPEINRSFLNLNGKNNYVEIPHHPCLTPNNLTVMLWVKKTGGDFGVLRKGTKGSAYYTNYEIFYLKDHIEVRFGIDGERYQSFWMGKSKLNEWTHLAFVFEDKKELRAYQDGVEMIKKAIDRLPPRQRLAVILNKYQGLSYREIAEVMECSEGAVKSYLHRAKENLLKLCGAVSYTHLSLPTN